MWMLRRSQGHMLIMETFCSVQLEKSPVPLRVRWNSFSGLNWVFDVCSVGFVHCIDWYVMRTLLDMAVWDQMVVSKPCSKLYYCSTLAAVSLMLCYTEPTTVLKTNHSAYSSSITSESPVNSSIWHLFPFLRDFHLPGFGLLALTACVRGDFFLA